ncbi:hypothetical protein G7Y89_g11019 [Cudoniella acicularis]|uniref:CFEM domain-containing protein n=1 Tax=Cudoniella acicularis TaxID=354080 RepID=A0A8H4W114_9HELO|nr:hypothetical protein G7Y89_g11019 [Cudoniella acicularis]
MKTTSFLVLALSAIAFAQDFPAELPDCSKVCAKPYFASNNTMFATCAVNDVACICTNTAFVNKISCCIFSNCNADDQAIVVDFATNLCTQVDVSGTPTLPTAASCPTPTTPIDTDTATPTDTATATAAATTTSDSAPTGYIRRERYF